MSVVLLPRGQQGCRWWAMSVLEDEIRSRIKARSTRRGKCLIWTGMVDSMGYAKAKLAPYWPAGGRVSRMILMIKLGRLPLSSEWACHTCDNPRCVDESHIYCGDAVTNNHDTVRRGRRTNGHAKTDRRIRTKIRREYATGRFTQSELASKYGVNQPRISQIVRSEE